MATLLSAPAHAGPISPDPEVGVRGIDDPAGTPSIKDASIFALTNGACSTAVDPALHAFYCGLYTNDTEVSLSSLDFSFWDAGGQPILATAENFFVSGESEFQLIRFPNQFEGDPFSDAHTVRLCATTFPGEVACNATDFGDTVIPSGATLAVFFQEAPGFVSARAWNTIPNSNLPNNSSPIPEPLTMMLMGSGLVGLVLRRNRRRRDDL